MSTVDPGVTGRGPRTGKSFTATPKQARAPPVRRSSLSVAEWCDAHGFSVAFFYKMRAEGWAPRTMSVGGCERISEQADRDWIAEREKAALLGVRRALPDNSPDGNDAPIAGSEDSAA